MAGPERKSVVPRQDWSEGPVSQAQNPFLQLLTQESAPGAHTCSYGMFTESERPDLETKFPGNYHGMALSLCSE